MEIRKKLQPSKKTCTRRLLKLHKDTVRSLSAIDLQQVHGADGYDCLTFGCINPD
jgi:hypothetical protein